MPRDLRRDDQVRSDERDSTGSPEHSAIAMP